MIRSTKLDHQVAGDLGVVVFMAVEGPVVSHRLGVVDEPVLLPDPVVEVQQVARAVDVAHRQQAAGIPVLVAHVGHVVVLAGQDAPAFVLLGEHVVADHPHRAVQFRVVHYRQDALRPFPGPDAPAAQEVQRPGAPRRPLPVQRFRRICENDGERPLP